MRLPQQNSLVRIKPSLPSGTPHQGPAVERLGLPHPTTAKPAATTPADNSPIHYQQVFQLTKATLAPYAYLTFPSLARDSATWRTIEGELLGISASHNGTLVALALAECKSNGTARLISLFVSPLHRRQGIATRLIAHLSTSSTRRADHLSVNYQAPQTNPPHGSPPPRLGWSTPQQPLLLKGEIKQLASITWPNGFLPEGYQLVPCSSCRRCRAATGSRQAQKRCRAANWSRKSLALLYHNTLWDGCW